MLNYCECLDWLGYVISWEFLKVLLYCATPSKHKAFRHQKLEKIITVSYETENSFEAQLIKCWNVIILDHTYSQISMDVKTTRNVMSSKLFIL